MSSVKQKFVFIAHPISGDKEGNIVKVIQIASMIHTLEIIPVFPLYFHQQYLKDAGEEIELHKESVRAYFECGKVDELWLFGSEISNGMRTEILYAQQNGIPVIPQTDATSRLLQEI